MKTENPTHLAVEQNFSDLHRAIENRTYDELDRLLAEQRQLIGNLPFADPEAQAYFVQAQDLTSWSLTMVKLQRSALEQTLAGVAKLRQLEKYKQISLAPQVL